MSFRPTPGLLILPVLHILLCVVEYLRPNDWQWIPLFVLDLPFALVIERLPFPPIVAYATFGTLWWYLLCCAGRHFFKSGAQLTLLRPSRGILIPPGLHLLLCFVAYANPNEGWQWLPVSFLDLPFSLLIAQLALPPIVPYAIFGTLWWYLLSVVGRHLLKGGRVTRDE